MKLTTVSSRAFPRTSLPADLHPDPQRLVGSSVAPVGRRIVQKHHLGSGGVHRLPLVTPVRYAPPDVPPPEAFTNTTLQDVQDARQPVVVPRPQQAPAEEQQVCDFYSHWWPVMPVVDLDASRPLPVELLGMRLVVWSDKQGAWHCFQDRCPHRLAPLSEGVVEGDTLLCTYHGWQFNQAGKCTVIPQMEDAKAHATACASPRNCVKTFPVKVL